MALTQMIRRAWEKAFGKWFEGPEIPERLEELPVAFANEHPHATRAEWVEFAQGLAREVWRSAYARGFENVERDPRPPYKDLPPEHVANMLDPDWQTSTRGITLQGDPVAVPPERPRTEEERWDESLEKVGRRP